MKGFKNERASIWQKASIFLHSLKGYGKTSLFKEVNTLLLFIGYPRSGHTLIGSLIDANPAAVIAHELDVLYYQKKGYSKSQIDYLLLKSSKKFTADGRQWMDYDYFVPGQWQGKHQSIKVVGDKSGGRTSRRLLNKEYYPELEKIQQHTDRELVFLHVIRNPYDIITTMMKRTVKRRDAMEGEKIFERKVRHFFSHAASVKQLIATDSYRIIPIYHEDFVASPQEKLSSICNKLGLPCSQEYLKACSALVWDKPKKSRHKTDLWSPKMIEAVKEEMRAYPWFDRYQF